MECPECKKKLRVEVNYKLKFRNLKNGCAPTEELILESVKEKGTLNSLLFVLSSILVVEGITYFGCL
jgi:hypothetical protein